MIFDKELDFLPFFCHDNTQYCFFNDLFCSSEEMSFIAPTLQFQQKDGQTQHCHL